jgi:hypothetical protein
VWLITSPFLTVVVVEGTGLPLMWIAPDFMAAS